MVGVPMRRDDRETVVGRCNDEDSWDVYSTIPKDIRKIRDIARQCGIPVEQNGTGVRARLPLTAISIRIPRQPRRKRVENTVS